MQVILSALIQGFSTTEDIVSALIQDFSSVQVFLISTNPRFSIMQELSGTIGRQHYTEVSAVQGSIVRGPSVFLIS